MSHRADAASALHRHIMQFLDSRYEQSYRDHCQSVFESEIPNTDLSSNDAKKLAEFSMKLLVETCQGIYVELRDDVSEQISKDISTLIDDLFSEEEAEELVTVLKNPVAQKLLRNTDLLRESYGKGLNRLIVETVRAWNSPEIQDLIDEYERRLLKRNDENFESLDDFEDFLDGEHDD